jgi:hypothetical protein
MTLTIEDDELFLNWIADRFVNVHGESENVDFVQRLRRTADRISQLTEQLKEAEWRPIETLEPEGITTYILWNGEQVFTGWRAWEGQWHCDQWADHNSEVDRPPTHWKPLPDPPSQRTILSE